VHFRGSCAWSNSSGHIDECQAEGQLRHGYPSAQEASSDCKSPFSPLSCSLPLSTCAGSMFASPMTGLHRTVAGMQQAIYCCKPKRTSCRAIHKHRAAQCLNSPRALPLHLCSLCSLELRSRCICDYDLANMPRIRRRIIVGQQAKRPLKELLRQA
jgi:hypothetical protein